MLEKGEALHGHCEADSAVRFKSRTKRPDRSTHFMACARFFVDSGPTRFAFCSPCWTHAPRTARVGVLNRPGVSDCSQPCPPPTETVTSP